MIPMQKAVVAMASLCLLLATQARAEPNDYVRMPVVVYGEKEIDFKTGVHKLRDGSSESANALGYGWTPAERWATEVYVKYARPAGERQGFDAWEWENRFQLTESGRYPVDVGLLLEIERPKDRAEGYELTWGPMLQKEWDRLQLNFNLFLQKHLRATQAYDTDLLYQLQWKYRDSAALEWGMQALGRLGPWDHWRAASVQEGQAGPALFGKIKTSPYSAVKWNAAWLAGFTQASPRSTLRLQAEYEF